MTATRPIGGRALGTHALLRVVLAPTARLAETWARQRSAIPIDALDTLDWGARRLVPLMAWRLREAEVDEVGTVTLRADLAASMLAARAKLPAFADVLATFEGAGLETLA